MQMYLSSTEVRAPIRNEDPKKQQNWLLYWLNKKKHVWESNWNIWEAKED